MSEAIIFRTHLYNSYWHKLLLKLNDSYQVVVIADTKKDSFNYNGLLQVEFSKENVERIGLSWENNLQWKCGDYAYYLASSVIDFNYAWMVEADVFINYDDLLCFFRSFDSNHSDFITTYFSRAESSWFWHDRLNVSFDKYRCFMPLTRISKQAVEYLVNQRIELGNSGNDEIFVSTLLMKSGYLIEDINETLNGVYSINSFSYDYPHYYWLLVSFNKKKKLIYHPCFFDFRSYLRHLLVKRSYKSVIKKLIKNRKSIG